MRQNTKNSDQFLDVDLSALTHREQEIFFMLLDGAIPKEIARALNISCNTFKTHQKNLYHKMGVHNIRDLIAKYSAGPAAASGPMETGKPAVFTRWFENKDGIGSTVSITEQIEHIEGQYFPTITLAGKLSPVQGSFAGTHALPDPSTLEDMRKMKSFSFKVLGDGNSYAVTIPTTDTRLKGEYNHYRKLITTKNGEISTIVINSDELAQVPYWGNPVPFIQGNIEFFQIHAYATGEFKLKIWCIRFFCD